MYTKFERATVHYFRLHRAVLSFVPFLFLSIFVHAQVIDERTEIPIYFEAHDETFP